MTPDRKLIRATYLLGLIPLMGGLAIFFSWWIGKAWLLTTFHKLENWGILWIFISLPAGFIGLLTSLVYLFKNYRTNWLKSFLGLLCVLVNIPVLIWVLNTQEDIDKRAYVRIYNKTGYDFKSSVIGNSLCQDRFNLLVNNDYQTGYFYPNYDESNISSGWEIEEVILSIETHEGERKIIVPVIYKGECVRFLIDDRYNIDFKRE